MTEANGATWADLALVYARKGWRMLPFHVYDRKKRECTCGNSCCSQHPRLDAEKATAAAEQIRKWHDRWQRSGIGLALGGPANLVALEISDLEGGRDTLSALKPSPGRLPKSPTFVANGTRRYYLYRYPSDAVGDVMSLGDGVRLHGPEAEPICLPPSLSKGYRGPIRWLLNPKDYDVVPLPEYICEAAELPPEPASTSGQATGSETSSGPTPSNGSAARDELPESARSATSGDGAMDSADSVTVGKPANGVAGTPNCGEPDILGESDFLNEPDPNEFGFQQLSEDGLFRRAQLRWFAWPWLAENALTILTGLPKRSGKTTFLLHMLGGVLRNKSFLDQPCTVGRVAYISDQSPDSFTQCLVDAGICSQRALDRFHLLYASQIEHKSWEAVVSGAADYVKNHNLDILIIDSIQPFLDAGPLHEQFAGPKFSAPLVRALDRGITIALTCSTSPSAHCLDFVLEDLGALANVADTVAHLKRPERGGMQDRHIEIASRFADVPSRVLIDHNGDKMQKQPPLYPLAQRGHEQMRQLTGRNRTPQDRRNPSRRR